MIVISLERGGGGVRSIMPMLISYVLCFSVCMTTIILNELIN